VKIVIIGIFILLSAGAEIFSQEMLLVADNKPLNTVLNMLGLEISFDHEALSKYRTSVSKSFENHEEALFYLLKNKPFRIEKIKNVYIIVPIEKKELLNRTENPPPENEKLFVPGKKAGIFPLRGAEIQLKEVIITEDKLQQDADRTIYQITSLFSEGAANAQELLDKLPELHFDQVSNRIFTSDNHTNILLLVNGIKQSSDYIKNLSPYRIQSIEVIHGLSGRFVSEGYDAVVNFKLKKNYAGYAVYASDFAAVYPAGTNGNDRLVAEQPLVGMTYTNRKINIYGSYSFDKDGWKLPAFKKSTVEGMELISGKILPGEPNYLYNHRNNHLSGGINYSFNPNQLIGIQGDYDYGNTQTSQIYRIRTFKTATNNRTKAQTFVGTVFYEGKINNCFQIYADFSYNYYYNDIENEYNHENLYNYKNGNLYNEYKNHTLFNLEGEYRLSTATALTFGYTDIWRKYASESAHGKGFLDYRERRNKVFLYFLFHPSGRLTAKLGMAAEQIRINNRNSENNYWRVLPYIQLNYKLNPNWNINLSYATDQDYPSLYQLSPMSAVIDTFLTQIGNPELKSSVRQTVSVRLSFRGRLTIVPSFSYTYDWIGEKYMKEEYKLYKTFHNIHTRENKLHLIYEQPFGRYFQWKNRLTGYYDIAMSGAVSNSVKGLLANSEINYYHPEKSFGMQLGYYRNMQKQILWQGYQMTGKDNWLITASKEFWNKRLSIRISYLPPVSWGIRYNQWKEVDTSLYKEKTCLNLEPYNHMFFVRINFRFDRESIKPSERYIPVEKEEREKQTIEFQ
jgi:hypothetical protein